MSLVNTVLTKIVGSRADRDLKKMRPNVDAINQLEPSMKALSDEALKDKTAEFRGRFERGASLDELLPEVFAVGREASRRVLEMRHFDVQLIGGMVLHQGKIAEMKTGEGKTLVATLPVYLNSLTGKGVHVVTVNDYLARRDAEWMGRLYRALGLTVGVIQHDMRDQERQDAYRADVTYGTNNELGFDYLRDNMKFDPSLFVHRLFPQLVKDADGKEAEKLFHYAIVDEVDSILIDEARTPLIISGPAEESTDLYYKIDRIIPRLRRDLDFTVDEKTRTVTLTEEGVPSVEKLLQVDNLYEPSQMHILHHVYQALRAHTLYKRDADYMVKDGQVIIVDEFTGRLMPGRRWSDGLHQAVEAKEHVKIERENQTLATITFQNYFRMYGKLAGMTGTAETEAAEFEKIYWLEVVPVPTNRNLIRDEYADMVYRTEREKLDAVVQEIREMQREGAPGPRRDHIHRQEREAFPDAQAGRREARGAEREISRDGGGDRGPGGAQGRGHHRDQHGGPRNRHSPRRQLRVPRESRGQEEGRRGRGASAERLGRGAPESEAGSRERARGGRRQRRPSHPRHRAPRVAANRQPAPRPCRPTGGSRELAVLPLARRRPDANLRKRPHQRPDAADGDGGRRSHRARNGDPSYRAGPEAGGGAELLACASTSSSTTT